MTAVNFKIKLTNKSHRANRILTKYCHDTAMLWQCLKHRTVYAETKICLEIVKNNQKNSHFGSQPQKIFNKICVN